MYFGLYLRRSNWRHCRIARFGDYGTLAVSGAHARLAPSSAHRWGPGGCPGSPTMEAKYPEDEESDAAREGTAQHWVALDEMLSAGRTPAVDTITPNGYPVTREMIEGGQMLADDVRGALAYATPGTKLVVEEIVRAEKWIGRDNWGTPDVYFVDLPRRHIAIWDNKYGHRQVDPYRNWQMLNYAAGILSEIDVMPSQLKLHDWRFTFTVCQPRSYHRDGPIREWQATGEEVCALLNELRIAAAATRDPAALCSTGTHCRDCRAAWDCAANQRAAGAGMDLAYEQQSTDMKPAALGLEARMLTKAIKRLEARKTSLDERIMATIRGGQPVPHWAIGSTQPRTVWKDDGEAIALGDMFGVDLRKVTTSMTPKQAIKAGIDAEVISIYATIPPSAAKLVEHDDATAAKVFGIRDQSRG